MILIINKWPKVRQLDRHLFQNKQLPVSFHGSDLLISTFRQLIFSIANSPIISKYIFTHHQRCALAPMSGLRSTAYMCRVLNPVVWPSAPVIDLWWLHLFQLPMIYRRVVSQNLWPNKSGEENTKCYCNNKWIKWENYYPLEF